MPEELPVQEDGAPEASESTTDWEQRYKDTHANWNSLNERFSRFEKDPNAVLEFLQEKHPDLLVDDDEEEDTYEEEDLDEDEQPLTRAEWKQWQAEQAQQSRAQAAQNKFETDFKQFVGDRELSPQGDAFVRYAATKGDIKGPDDLKKTINDWFAYEDGLRPAKAKPRVPHVPTSGQAATQVPNWGEMTPGEINRYLAERVAGHQAQT
jgi:hypothetical protein